jgi:hypothetical protein
MEALEMERPMTEWNDDRLDELNGRVKDGFAQIDREMKEGFAKVDKRFEQVASREEMVEVKANMRHLDERFDRLYYTILVTVVGLAGSLFASNVWG